VKFNFIILQLIIKAQSCSSLQSVILEDVASLQAHDLTGSLHLNHVHVQGACSMTKLSLKGCRSLDCFQIDCPNLRDINVTGARAVAFRFSKNIRHVILKTWMDST
jgi:hypothetical protein